MGDDWGETVSNTPNGGFAEWVIFYAIVAAVGWGLIGLACLWVVLS